MNLWKSRTEYGKTECTGDDGLGQGLKDKLNIRVVGFGLMDSSGSTIAGTSLTLIGPLCHPMVGELRATECKRAGDKI